MRWQGGRESENIEDRRAMPVKGVAAGGGMVAIIVVVVMLLMGKDPTPLLNQLQQQGGLPSAGQTQAVDPREEPLRQFVAVILADTEDVWARQFPQISGRQYNNPTLVLFKGSVSSACGFASAATGPFYCPEDRKVYLDLMFFSELQNRFKAPGDFACAYVVAHEVGHHVQNLLGISDQVHEKRRSLSEAEYNKLSVRLELQADYLAGCWAYHANKAKQYLEPGDLQEALGAAKAIGDDALQRGAQGYVVPDSFTHGTSDQRVRWFRKGFDSGNVAAMTELFELPYDRL